jgi:hypothetical protein
MKPKIVLSLLFCLVCVTSVSVVIASREKRESISAPMPAVYAAPQDPTDIVPYPDRIWASRLTPQLRIPFNALGNRLAQRGKERLSSIGTITKSGTSRPVLIESEFPNRLRVTGPSEVLVTFNARSPREQQFSHMEAQLIETLFLDSPEYFFVAQARGAATRCLGSRMSLSEDTSGPFYDVYEVVEEIPLGNSTLTRIKRYFFNSDSQMLELVRYQAAHEGEDSVSVETHFGGWRTVERQRVPATIERRENGAVIFSIALTTTTIAPRDSSSSTAPQASMTTPSEFSSSSANAPSF